MNEEKLEFYEVDNDYIQLLHDEVDDRVTMYHEEPDRQTRKYIGPVLTIDKYTYLAPLSSRKPKDYEIGPDNKKHIKRNTLGVKRIIRKNKKTKKKRLLANIYIWAMIPVPEEKMHLFNIKTDTDNKGYRILLKHEMQEIKKMKGMIRSAAKKAYSIQMNEFDPSKQSKFLPFNLLEEKYDEIEQDLTQKI